MGVCRSFHRLARAAPRSAVAELGVVRRRYPRPVKSHLFIILFCLTAAASARSDTAPQSVSDYHEILAWGERVAGKRPPCFARLRNRRFDVVLIWHQTRAFPAHSAYYAYAFSSRRQGWVLVDSNPNFERVVGHATLTTDGFLTYWDINDVGLCSVALKEFKL